MALLSLPVREGRVLARGDQLGVGGAMWIVASGAQCFIEWLAVVRLGHRLAFQFVAARAKCGLRGVVKMRGPGLALRPTGQVVDVAGLAARFQRSMDEFLFDLRCHRSMTTETLVVLRSGAGNVVGRSSVGWLLNTERPYC